MNPKMKENYMNELSGNNKKKFVFRANIETPLNYICYIYENINGKFEHVEYRGGLNIADNFMFVNIGEMKSKFPDDAPLYVAVSKINTNIQFEFDKSIFELLNPTKFKYYISTLKKFFMYLISLKFKNLDTVSKTIIGNVLYSGLTLTEVSNLLNVRESDIQQLLSGLTIKTKVLDLDKIADALRFNKDEYNPKYYNNLLEEYHG